MYQPSTLAGALNARKVRANPTKWAKTRAALKKAARQEGRRSMAAELT